MPTRKTSNRSNLPAVIPTRGSRDVEHRLTGGGTVRADAVFHVPGVHPLGAGPWAGEADKIAWTDPMSGLGCIILRSPMGGHLRGHVSVPSGHPLFGRRIESLGHLLIGVHGGLNYAAACQSWEAEEVSVCHPGGRETRRRVVGREFSQQVHANEAAVSGDDAWWFGFSCDHPGDVLPGTNGSAQRHPALTGLNHATYKDEAFVHEQCVRLAAQLKAIGDGLDPRRHDPGPSSRLPIGRTGG